LAIKVVVAVVQVVVLVEVVIEVPVEATVEATVVTTGAEVMDQPIAPKMDHSITMITTVGPMGMIVLDKILESLASGTNTEAIVTSHYLKTTAQHDSCNKASHIDSQLIHSVWNIAYPLNSLL
jgi:hypothetical protein